jgi:hypothetical protein
MSRRTIVVFHLPTNELVYLEREDLDSKPIAGDNYTLEGVRYQVTDVLESIGEYKAEGARRAGMDKLLEVLALRFDNEAVTLLARLRNVGSGDQPQVGPGGIFLPLKTLIGDFDHVILVSVQNFGKRATGNLLGLLHSFAHGEQLIAQPAAPDKAQPIRVGEDAAG